MFSIIKFIDKYSTPIVVNVDSYEEMLKEYEVFLCGREQNPMERMHSSTSPWMNRLKISDSFIIIPENLKHNDDIVEATEDRFVVAKLSGNDFAPIDDKDVLEFLELLERAHIPEEHERRRNEMIRKKFYGIMFQLYRQVYVLESDEHIARLRKTLESDPETCRLWAKAFSGGAIDESALKQSGVDPDFADFLIRTNINAHMVWKMSDFIETSDGRSLLTLSQTLRDPELVRMLIKALDPESISILRESFEMMKNIWE